MEWNLQNIFSYPPIYGVTINTVLLSPAFRELVYYIIIISFILATTFFLSKKLSLKQALRKALLASFFISGFVYTVHADVGWAKWIMHDSKMYGGLDTEEKLLRMDDGLYDFSRKAKKLIRGEYALYAAEDYIRLRTEYFLLPLRKRSDAKYIIVLLDKEAAYNPASHTFVRGDKKINNAYEILHYQEGAYILEKR